MTTEPMTTERLEDCRLYATHNALYNLSYAEYERGWENGQDFQ